MNTQTSSPSSSANTEIQLPDVPSLDCNTSKMELISVAIQNFRGHKGTVKGSGEIGIP